ncbi:hypothetical protein ACK3TF_000458 [Chlorella vulgaris]
MGKQRNKRARAAKQHGMDVEEGGDVAATAAANADWQTGPVDGHDDDDAAGMDTGEAVAAAGQLNGQTRSKQFLKVKRGARSAKQKQRKRKSLERALATADKVDTKTAREGSRVASKKSLKKLWTNSKGECGGK